jgi:cystathionine beta-lyase/cystathionine gamma-synthase
MVISLSKYPSSGLDFGGAVLSNDATLLATLRRSTSRVGHVLPLHAAHAINQNMLWFASRMMDLSEKALRIARYLRTHPAVREGRIPDAVNGLVGGQVCFLAKDVQQADVLEKLVGHNLLRVPN